MLVFDRKRESWSAGYFRPRRSPTSPQNASSLSISYKCTRASVQFPTAHLHQHHTLSRRINHNLATLPLPLRTITTSNPFLAQPIARRRAIIAPFMTTLPTPIQHNQRASRTQPMLAHRAQHHLARECDGELFHVNHEVHVPWLAGCASCLAALTTVDAGRFRGRGSCREF